MTGAAERLAKIGEAVARLHVVGQEEGWSGHVHVAVYVADLSFVLACLRDAEQRAEQAEAERANAAEAATEAATVALWLDVRGTEAKLTRAEAALDRVREQHPRVDLDRPVEGVTAVCDYDGVPWPCPTMAALSAPADDGGEG